MRALKRNKVKFYYAPFVERQRSDKGYGFISIYGDAVAVMGNISPATGTTSVEQFGNNVDYDKVIVLDNPNTSIDENSILFLEIAPEKNTDGDYIYDYIVKKVARSLNSVSVAVSKVNVS